MINDLGKDELEKAKKKLVAWKAEEAKVDKMTVAEFEEYCNKGLNIFDIEMHIEIKDNGERVFIA